MALELNFLHEQLRLQKRRSRDPFKLALLMVLLLATGLVFFYFYRGDQVRRLRNQRLALEQEFKRLEPLQAQALIEQQSLEATFKTGEKVAAKINGRFLWAPLLATVVEAIPRNVQLTGLNASMLANDTHRAVVDLVGIAAEKEPRIAAEGVRAALSQGLSQMYQATANFQSLEDGGETVFLEGHDLPTALFNIRVEIIRPAPAPSIPPRKSRKP